MAEGRAGPLAAALALLTGLGCGRINFDEGASLADGEICRLSTECESGVCTDGRCCREVCTAACTVCGALGTCEPSLGTGLVSSSPDRSSPTPLAGAVLGQASYIFFEPCVPLSVITFRIDTADAQPVHDEDTAPWDFVGSLEDLGVAAPLIAGMIPGGEHTLYTVLEATDGRGQRQIHHIVAADAPPGIMVSSSPMRTNLTPLAGTTRSGTVFLVLFPDGRPFPEKASFYLDDPDALAEPVNEELTIPFDIMGGMLDTPTPLDTTTLVNGPHSITTVLHRPDGTTATTLTSFSISNP